MNPVSRLLAGLTLRPQGSTLVVAGFLPIFAIVTMFPVVASMIQHFADDPDARAKVPMMVTAPGLAIAVLAPFAGYAVDRFGRRKLLLWCTFFYGLSGAAPFFLDDLDHIFATRLMLGVCEAGILTIVNTLVGDYWDEQGRRNWIFVQGFLGTLFASGVIMLSGAISALQWNAGFLIYLVAFPILLAMVAFLHEPSGDAAATAVPAGLSSAPARSPFPTAAAAAVAVVTLLSSILYYTFVVKCSNAFAEIRVRDQSAVSRATIIPTLFYMDRAVVFRVCAVARTSFSCPHS